MVVHIIPGSASLVVQQRPELDPPVVEVGRRRPTAVFRTRNGIRINGSAIFGAEGGDSTDGWKIGLIQAAYEVEDWAYYRGEHQADGSVLVRLNELHQRACRDCSDTTPVSNFFYHWIHGEQRLSMESLPENWVDHIFDPLPPRDIRPRVPAPPRIGLPLPVYLYDEPGCSYWTTVENRLTRKLNYLAEAVSEVQFCTVLSVQKPNRTFDHLLHVYWSLRWHATFLPRTFSESSADFSVAVMPRQMRGQEVWVSRVIEGAPRAPILGAKFADVLTTHQHQSCNQMGRDRMNAYLVEGPHRQVSDTWQKSLPDRHRPKSPLPYVPLAWRWTGGP